MNIYAGIGAGLILLGGASGLALFARATAGKTDHGDTATLWGLFLVGLVAGLVLLEYGLGR